MGRYAQLREGLQSLPLCLAQLSDSTSKRESRFRKPRPDRYSLLPSKTDATPPRGSTWETAATLAVRLT